MSESAVKQVLNRLYSCKAGQIRNPRTDRCVSSSKPLGQALVAAAQTLRTQGRLPACPAGKVHDPASRACTSDRYRSAALKELAKQYGWARAANGSSSGLAKLVTSQALAKAVATNTRREYDSFQSDVRAYITRLEADRAQLEAALFEAQEALLQAGGEHQAVLARLDACTRKLAMMNSSIRRNAFKN